MSFFSNIFQSGRQPANPLFCDPFDEIFPEQAQQRAQDRLVAEEKRLHKEAKIREVAAWWQKQMNNLADKHAECVANVIADRSTKAPALLSLEVQEQREALEIGHGLLLHQSDTRWGKKTTDDALKSLGHDVFELRREAR
jgi:hypothetical protein